MEQPGKLLTCDRCGKQTFIEYIGEGEADGGFTRWAKYADKPEGWSYVSREDTTGMKDKMKLLCDKCYAEYNACIKSFFEAVKEEA